MLGPIALYPDPLLAQLLPAATQPTQVVLAARYLHNGGDPNQIDLQAWDPSLKALAHYPEVLFFMDSNLDWTIGVGQVFLNQPADVMGSIQRLRAQALALGNLQTTPQQQVIVEPDLIQIVPATPQIIYVPVYQPAVVYVQRAPLLGPSWISFSVGLAIGAWLNHDCDWRRHDIIVWHRNQPRPSDWWYRRDRDRVWPAVTRGNVVINNVYVERPGVSVWQPRNRPGLRPVDPAARGWEPRDLPVRTVEPSRPVGPPNRTPPRTVETRPAQPNVRVAPPTAPRATIKPAPPIRPSGGVVAGVESARETRAISNRGQQSRQVIARPAPVGRPPPPTSAPQAPADSKPKGR